MYFVSSIFVLILLRIRCICTSDKILKSSLREKKLKHKNATCYKKRGQIVFLTFWLWPIIGGAYMVPTTCSYALRILV